VQNIGITPDVHVSTLPTDVIIRIAFSSPCVLPNIARPGRSGTKGEQPTSPDALFFSAGWISAEKEASSGLATSERIDSGAKQMASYQI